MKACGRDHVSPPAAAGPSLKFTTPDHCLRTKRLARTAAHCCAARTNSSIVRVHTSCADWPASLLPGKVYKRLVECAARVPLRAWWRQGRRQGPVRVPDHMKLCCPNKCLGAVSAHVHDLSSWTVCTSPFQASGPMFSVWDR